MKSKKDQEEKLHGEQSDELASQDWMKTGKEIGSYLKYVVIKYMIHDDLIFSIYVLFYF